MSALFSFLLSFIAFVVSPINDGIIQCSNPEVYGATHQVRWGYNNSGGSANILVGEENRFIGTPNINAGQPEVFDSGRFVNIFRTAIAPGQTFVWRLNKKTATASIPQAPRIRECLPN